MTLTRRRQPPSVRPTRMSVAMAAKRWRRSSTTSTRWVQQEDVNKSLSRIRREGTHTRAERFTSIDQRWAEFRYRISPAKNIEILCCCCWPFAALVCVKYCFFFFSITTQNTELTARRLVCWWAAKREEKKSTRATRAMIQHEKKKNNSLFSHCSRHIDNISSSHSNWAIPRSWYSARSAV